MKTIPTKIALLSLCFAILETQAAVQFAFNGVSDNMTGDYGYYYAVTAGLFPNRTGSPPVPNGDRSSGTGVIMHINDDPGRNPGGRWFQDWDNGTIDGWFEDTSGIAMTLSNNGSSVYDNNGIDDGTYATDYYGSGHGGVSYSMANNFDEVTAGYFRMNASTTIDEISGYFIGYGGFDASLPTNGLHFNIFNASISDADPAPDPPLTYSPTVNSFTGDILSSHAGAASFEAGSMTVVDSGVNIDVFGSTYDIMRGTYTLDTPITLEPGDYYFAHHAAIAIPEPSAGILLGLCAAGMLMRRRTKIE